jgi:L-aminopeptidase/D-esterase-like protein
VGAVAVAALVGAIAAPAYAATGPNNAITDVPGIEVGHSTREDAWTGTTALLFRGGALMGYAPAGGAPGDRLSALLTAPHQDGRRVVFHGLSLSGGSIYGLDTVCGIVKYLREQGLGFGTPPRPYVPGAIIFDLRGGRPVDAPPGKSTAAVPDVCHDGYVAASNATTGPIAQGSVGGGTGARAGGLTSGFGTASTVLSGGIVVGAAVVVNPGGSVYNTTDGTCELYGLWLEDSNEFGDVRAPVGGCTGNSPLPALLPGQNTTIGIVATNAPLTAGQVQRMAIIAGDGMARSIRPAHGNGDGDTVFAVSVGHDASTVAQESYVGNSGTIYNAAADAYSRAIVHAVLRARPDRPQETYCERFPSACPSGGLPSLAGAASPSAVTSQPPKPAAPVPSAGDGGRDVPLGWLGAALALLAFAGVAAAARARKPIVRRARLVWLTIFGGIVVLGVAAAPAVAAPGPKNAITDVPGVRVGHSTRADARTGTTSLVFPDGSLIGFASAGGAPETHLVELLTGQHQDSLRVAIHGIVLSGGSVYGLDTVCGTVRWLDEQGLGFGGRAHVAGATIFDLGRGSVDAPPGTGADVCADGYRAASTATDGPVAQGSVGAGTGAMAGGVMGGLGSASTVLPDGTVVGALVVANPSGRVYNVRGECELFGLDLEEANEFGGARARPAGCKNVNTSLPKLGPLEANTLAVIATSAPLTAGQTEQLAIVAGDGLAKVTEPAHASQDGNAVFGVTLVEDPSTVPQSSFVEAEELAVIYEAAVDTVARAFTHAILKADPALGETYCERFKNACKGGPNKTAVVAAPRGSSGPVGGEPVFGSIGTGQLVALFALGGFALAALALASRAGQRRLRSTLALVTRLTVR